jgi:hypothetical protein
MQQNSIIINLTCKKSCLLFEQEQSFIEEISNIERQRRCKT